MSAEPAPDDAMHTSSAPKPSWRRRWLVVRAVLGYCGALVAWLALAGPDDGVRESAILGAFGLAGAVTLGYLGFATQDDRNWLAAVASLPRRAR